MRNIQTHPAWRRFRYGSFYAEMELVHNMHRLLVLPEFTEYDVYWLNTQSRIFVKQGNKPVHGLYEEITARIGELFTLVPEPLKHKLTWSGPKRVGANY